MRMMRRRLNMFIYFRGIRFFYSSVAYILKFSPLDSGRSDFITIRFFNFKLFL